MHSWVPAVETLNIGMGRVGSVLIEIVRCSTSQLGSGCVSDGVDQPLGFGALQDRMKADGRDDVVLNEIHRMYKL